MNIELTLENGSKKQVADVRVMILDKTVIGYRTNRTEKVVYKCQNVSTLEHTHVWYRQYHCKFMSGEEAYGIIVADKKDTMEGIMRIPNGADYTEWPDEQGYLEDIYETVLNWRKKDEH